MLVIPVGIRSAMPDAVAHTHQQRGVGIFGLITDIPGYTAHNGDRFFHFIIADTPSRSRTANW
jgi:hypothetical protein